jgi:predicted DNA-binding antitoxin AbrB/MazE fold protein
MGLQFDAIYENGVLRPLQPLQLADRAKVTVTIELPALGQAAINGCFGTLSAESAAEMQRIVEAEFARVDPRDW